MLTLGVVQTGELNEFEIRSLDGELEALCASVDDVFARPASRENLRAMVRGLLSEVPRKNLWQLAEFAGHPNPDRLQGFLAKAAWDADELRDRVRAYAVAALVADDAVLIADETGDIKKGTKTAGVQRQYIGTAGRIENAQVSVHLSYGSSRGRTLIDRELYLGRAWAGTTAEHEHRCAEQGIPPERATEVATKPELARHALAPLAHPPSDPSPRQPLPHANGPRSLTVKPPAVTLVVPSSPTRVVDEPLQHLEGGQVLLVGDTRVPFRPELVLKGCGLVVERPALSRDAQTSLGILFDPALGDDRVDL